MTRPKVLFKYTPKDKRQPGQKPLSATEKAMNSLMTSYTCPLRKIDQSVPKKKLVIHKHFGEKRNEDTRVVFKGESSKLPDEQVSSKLDKKSQN